MIYELPANELREGVSMGGGEGQRQRTGVSTPGVSPSYARAQKTAAGAYRHLMGSWKDGEIGHRRVAGDLVELRDIAERGVNTLFRVQSVDGNGDVHLSQVRQGARPASDAIFRVASDDVGEAVFLARAEVLAAHAHSTGLAERI